MLLSYKWLEVYHRSKYDMIDHEQTHTLIAENKKSSFNFKYHVSADIRVHSGNFKDKIITVLGIFLLIEYICASESLF